MARKRHLKWCDGDFSVVLEFAAPKDSAHDADLRTMFDEVAEAYKRFARKSRDGAPEVADLPGTVAEPITGADWHTVAQQKAEALATAEAEIAELRRARERSDDLWDVVNNLSLCHQCQPEMENALAEAGEAWDAGDTASEVSRG